MRGSTSCIEVSAEAHSLFLTSFEKWVEAGMTCHEHGDSPEERAQAIQISYRRAIQANIDYHNAMIDLAAEAGENDIAGLHSAIAEGYKAILNVAA